MPAEALLAFIRNSAPWRDVEIEDFDGRDFLGAPTEWLVVRAWA